MGEDFRDYLEYCETEGGSNKHTEGKASGARYAFLDRLPGKGGDRSLGIALNNLVMGLDLTKTVSEVEISYVFYQTIKEAERIGIDLISNFVKSRYSSIKSSKYKAWGYRDKSIKPDLLLDAIARHYIAYICGEDIDPESGAHHLGHILSNLCLLNN